MSYAKGLEGVVAGETAISNVDGEGGKLSYRGYAIEDLANCDYLDVMHLVLWGDLPSASERERLHTFLMAEGDLGPTDSKILSAIPPDTHPMQMLQAMIPILDLSCDEKLPLDHEGHRGLAIVAKLPTLIARFRAREDTRLAPIHDPATTYLGNFMQMFTGIHNAEHEKVLSAVQVLQMEHSLNCGTFAARVVASSLAPVEAALAAGVAALAGPLHGGADEAALRNAKSIGNLESVGEYIDNLLTNKGKLMGMGHREYRRVDPRAVILKPMAAALCTEGKDRLNYLLLEEIERDFNARMKLKGRDIWANLEFYKGAVLEAIGIPEHYFTAMFTMARSVGWLAHFIESRQDNRIMRPAALYVGEPPRKLPRQRA